MGFILSLIGIFVVIIDAASYLVIGDEYNGLRGIFFAVVILLISCLAFFAGDKATQMLSAGLVILIGLIVIFIGVVGVLLDFTGIFGGFMATLGGILMDSGILVDTRK